jgi:hypothetical protein
MSTAVGPAQPASPATEPQPTPGEAPSAARRRPWHQRNYRIAAALLVLALLAVAVANNVLARQYTPDGAVRQYLSALQSGNAATAWNEIQVSAPTQPVTASLVDQVALRAALAAAKPDIRGFNVTSTTQVDAATDVVAFSYDTTSGTKQAKFTVRQSGEKSFGLYPLWHLIILPTILQVTLPKGSSGISVDGRALALPAGTSTIAVLPLAHQVQIGPTQVLSSQTVPVDAFFSAGQTLNYQPVLTAAGLVKVKGAIKAAFSKCALRTDPNADVDGCPQTIGYSISGSGSWKIVGDPTQDMVVSFDKNMSAVATGHYQMVFAYQESGVQGVQHSSGSGGYSAALNLGPDAVTAASIQPADGLPTLVRPSGASDQAGKDLVAQTFKRCAAVRAQSVADCPQALISIASNVRWTLVGNPLSGASVNFDPNSGQFTVSGSFAMTVSYDFLGYPKTDSSFNTTYVADLFWNGKSLQLVTITGSN